MERGVLAEKLFLYRGTPKLHKEGKNGVRGNAETPHFST